MTEYDLAVFMLKNLSPQVKEYLKEKVPLCNVKEKESLTDFYFKVSLYFPEIFAEYKKQSETLMQDGVEILSIHNEKYPKNIIRKLKSFIPDYFYTAGDTKLCNNKSVAVTGTRNINSFDTDVSKKLGQVCAGENLTLVTGGAPGVDTVSAEETLKNGGTCVIYLPCGIKKSAFYKNHIKYINNGKLLCLSSVDNSKDFSAYQALRRNKYIHSHGDISVTVHASLHRGGTWSGAYDNLMMERTPLIVCDDYYSGNRELINLGAYCLKKEELFDKEFSFFKLFT